MIARLNGTPKIAARITAGKSQGASRSAWRHDPWGSRVTGAPTVLHMTLRGCYRSNHTQERKLTSINAIASLRTGVAAMGRAEESMEPRTRPNASDCAINARVTSMLT